jgi:stringent starvation protein B
MISRTPYLLRAMYEWIVDSGGTPYLLVDADAPLVVVPRDYVDDGKIVLNISAAAVRGLEIGADAVSFDSRFGGKPFTVSLPIHAIRAIYSKESSEGMMFEPETDADQADETGDDPDDSPPAGHLKVVK